MPRPVDLDAYRRKRDGLERVRRRVERRMRKDYARELELMPAWEAERYLADASADYARRFVAAAKLTN